MDPFDDLDLLGLPPGSPPDALKVAWRRAVANLHPDRDPTRDASRLAEVNAAYQRLESYRQRHGRLPDRRLAARPIAAPRPPARPRRRWTAVAIALAGVAVVLAWPPADDAAPEDELPGTVAVPASTLLGTHPDRIHVGSTRDEVRRLAGRPTLEEGDVWIYGPSEIRFEDDRVVEWHDSALRPLPVDAGGTGLR